MLIGSQLKFPTTSVNSGHKVDRYFEACLKNDFDS